MQNITAIRPAVSPSDPCNHPAGCDDSAAFDVIDKTRSNDAVYTACSEHVGDVAAYVVKRAVREGRTSTGGHQPLRFRHAAAVEYIAMQAPVTDPENARQAQIAKAVREARRSHSNVVHLPLGADLNLFTSIVQDAEANAMRHANDRDTFSPVERNHAGEAANALAHYTA